MSDNSLQVNDNKRRSHSNTVSGGRPPALDIEIGRPTFVRRNSEGSPRLPPPICVSEPTPVEPSKNYKYFNDTSSSRNSSRPPSPNSDSSSPPPPGPLPQSSSTAPIGALLESPKTKTKTKSRSRASSLTSSLINEIKENPTIQHFASKIKSRHSSEEPETNSFEAVTSAPASVVSSSILANTKRNQDFHALFRSVPEDDCLIEDFGCALQKEILLQGRIYLSENYLCFNANIFGWVTNLVIAFADIIDIEKKATAYFIPNAIQISTDNAKHFFASFLSRDQAHDLMVDLWRAARPDLIPSKNGDSPEGVDEASPSSEEDSDSYYDSDTEDSFSDSSSESSLAAKGTDRDSPVAINRARKESLVSLQGTKGAKSPNSAARRRAISEVQKPSYQTENKTSVDNTSQKPVTPPNDKASNAGSEKPVEKPQMHDTTECDCFNDHFSTTVMDQVYDGTLESLYNLLFHTEFMKKFLLENQKSTELTIGDWKKGEGDIQLTRESSYIKQLNSTIGPKSTKCMITEDILHKDFDKFITIMTTTSTPDVPSGGSFSCKTRTCLTWSGKGKVRILVTVLVDFTKSSWLKSTIEKASIDGQQTYYKDLDTALRAYLKKSVNGFGDNSSNQQDVKRRKKGRKSRKNQSLSKQEAKEVKEEQVDAVHRVLGAFSNKLADAITDSIHLVTSPTSSHLTLLCLITMVLINIFIAKKMAFVEQQLNSLNHASDYMEADAVGIQYTHETNKPHRREYNRQEEEDLWDWLGRIDPDKSSPVKERVMQPVSDSAEQEIIWDSAIQSSKAAKDKLDRHMAELSQMIQKAESNLEQVTNAVKEQRQKIKQEV